MKILKKMLKYTKNVKFKFFIALFSLVIATFINLLIPSILRNFLNNLQYGNLTLTAVFICSFYLLVLYLVKSLANFFNYYYSHLVAMKMVTNARIEIYSHIQKLSLKYFSKQKTGSLMANVMNDVGSIENLISHFLPDLIVSILIFAGVSIALININMLLAICSLLPILISLMFLPLYEKVRTTARFEFGYYADLNSLLQDSLSGIKEIQLFNKQKKTKKDIMAKSILYENASIKTIKRAQTIIFGINFFCMLGTVVAVGMGGIFVIKGWCSALDVVTFILYHNLFYTPISILPRVFGDIQRSLSGIERAFEILDINPEIRDLPFAKKIKNVEGSVRFEHVSFEYEENTKVLDDISFVVNPKEMVAIVGATGAGKSTIASLIARFYEPVNGHIYIDGNDIQHSTLLSLRQQISMVFQDVFLFNGTIAQNIAYSIGDAKIEQIEKVAQIACIDEFIKSLPMGYDTIVGEKGIRLSGGQRQRIAIARCLLSPAPIIIFDEATSAIDNKTEYKIQNSLSKVIGKKTIIVIAHRLSTIVNADKIIVLNKGKICEVGTHKELLKNQSVYSDLYKKQQENI